MPAVGDCKTELQELVQRKSGSVLTYELLGESGPDHDKTFTSQVSLNGRPIGSGSGRTKKEAEQAAASAALRELKQMSARESIIPVFVPHLGCPNDCVFCNQRRISGSVAPATPEDVVAAIERAKTLTGRRRAANWLSTAVRSPPYPSASRRRCWARPAVPESGDIARCACPRARTP